MSAERGTAWPQAKRRAHEVRKACDAFLCAQRHQIGGRTLQLAGILNEDNAVAGLGDLCQQRIGERGLAGRCAAGNEDILAPGDSVCQRAPASPS